MFVRAASHIIEYLPAKPQYKKSQLDSVQIIADLPAELKQEINQLDSVQIIENLPTEPKQPNNQNHSVSSYQELQKFQQYRQELNAVCSRLYLTLRDGSDRNVLSPSLTAEVEKESCKLQSQRFRVAVVGEFSKGKSTLLNALLGEEIHPVRDIPCSGTVTVLKYGQQQRVICKYKDGREEEISPEEYQDKAAISEEAALGDVGNELINSELQEIIFEHPNLELCCNGVEIIDTPGLNEQAERTLVTEQVLKTTDAVIFLTHAHSVLTEKERELLLYLKKELNPDRDDEAARNIFILVNFADLLRREESRRLVRKRVETIVMNQNLIAGENRIHLISAQSALEAILDGTENQYVKSFQDFTKSLEEFLIEKRGAIALQESAAGLKQIIDTGCEELNQYQKMLDGKLTLPEADKQKIFEQMAEVSGRDVKIRVLARKIRQECLEESHESWNEWLKGLRERIISKSANWTSKHSHLLSQDQLTVDYANQFVRELTQDINFWTNHKLSEIVKQKIGVLDDQIYDNVEPICKEFELFDKRLNTNLFIQFKDFATSDNRGGIRITGIGIAASISTIGVDVGGFVGGTLGIGAAVGAALFYLTGVGTITVILGALVAAAGGGVGWGLLEGEAVKAQIKQKVCDLGFPKFEESSQSILVDSIQEKIIAVFEKIAEASSDVMSKAIALWENLLEQQEKRDLQNQAECETQKVWLADKRRELEQVQNQIEAILNQSAE
ncbi:MAG TPA: dynamin [Microcoleaceae bacterium UBA10368]|nr:dynamin [Microcoleaceae cyanobacterium UBA10368]HCV29095.1 dynamin [Microcoleaceae cyanobacterium UBA9251]